MVDGRLWSTAVIDEPQTQQLRADPRCTLYVEGPGFAWRALEATVAILDGPEAPELNLRLFRTVHRLAKGNLGQFEPDLTDEVFLDRMRAEGRMIFDFHVRRCYGEP